MKYNYRKSLLILGMIIFVAVSLSWNEAPPGDERNLQVLPKDISADSLERIMDGFVTALSVNCAYCHTAKDPAQPKKLDYASDANPHKEITRNMMRMTIEINNKFLKTLPVQPARPVGCVTCHRGQPVPVAD